LRGVYQLITNPIERAKQLRETLVQGDTVLVVDFSDTLEGQDSSKVVELMPNVATGERVFRTKVNVKGIDPLASGEYKVPFFDLEQKTEKEIEAFVNDGEFDFPLWFKHQPGFSMKRVADYNLHFTFQIGGCNFHDGSAEGGCWYCFVDDASNNGIPGKGKALLEIDETVRSMISAREMIREFYSDKAGKEMDLRVLRCSGGEPMIALDWILNLWRQIGKGKGTQDFVGQVDTNLSTGPLVDYFEKEGVFEKFSLEKLAHYPVKILAAIKGTDPKNLEQNVQSKTTLEIQRYSIVKLIKAGLEIFPQIYNPNPETLECFLSDMDDRIENFSLKAHLGPLKLYGPTRERLAAFAKRNHLDTEELIRQKKAEWDENYKRGEEVISDYVRRRHGAEYKEVSRADVVFRLRK